MTGPGSRAPARLLRRAVHALRRSRRGQLGVAAALVLVATGGYALVQGDPAADVVRLVAAGDMACDPDDPQFLAHSAAAGDHCRHQEVSDVAVALSPDYLLGLGDYQHELPTTAAYREVYGPSWGRLRAVTIPVYGNQEYKVRDANVFTAYFGDRVLDERGYWSQDVGQWHVVVLNSNCGAVAGGCTVGSPQQLWLADDLRHNATRCVLAAWHHPRWSTGLAGPDTRTKDLFDTLYEYHVELVVSGHEAHYERFGPTDPHGRPDPHGVRQYVSGVGGQAHYARPADARPWMISGSEPLTSEFAEFNRHGVLELVLRPDSWQWRFHALDAAPDGKTPAVIDEGTDHCS